MGTGASKFGLNPEELQELKQKSGCALPVTDKELKIIGGRFNKADLDSNGVITRDEFLKIPELVANCLVDRLFTLFDSDDDNRISFVEYVKALSIFRRSASNEMKKKYAFLILDFDADGILSHGDLVIAFKMIYGRGSGIVSDEMLGETVDRLLAMADFDGDGGLNENEFGRILPQMDILSRMVLQF